MRCSPVWDCVAVRSETVWQSWVRLHGSPEWDCVAVQSETVWQSWDCMAVSPEWDCMAVLSETAWQSWVRLCGSPEWDCVAVLSETVWQSSLEWDCVAVLSETVWQSWVRLCDSPEWDCVAVLRLHGINAHRASPPVFPNKWMIDVYMNSQLYMEWLTCLDQWHGSQCLLLNIFWIINLVRSSSLLVCTWMTEEPDFRGAIELLFVDNNLNSYREHAYLLSTQIVFVEWFERSSRIGFSDFSYLSSRSKPRDHIV